MVGTSVKNLDAGRVGQWEGCTGLGASKAQGLGAMRKQRRVRSVGWEGAKEACWVVAGGVRWSDCSPESVGQALAVLSSLQACQLFVLHMFGACSGAQGVAWTRSLVGHRRSLEAVLANLA